MASLGIFMIVLGVLIVVHEFGHFITAKLLGVRVEKFSLGFGPRLLSKKRKGTEYSISAIPLGGFVKLAGDNLEECKGTPDEYFSQAPGRRFWIIFFGSFLNYVLGILCFWFIFFTGYPALTAKVGGLLDGFGAKDVGMQLGDTIKAIDGKDIALWDDLQEIIRTKKPQEKVMLTVTRGAQALDFEVVIKAKEVDDLLGQKQSVGLLGITPNFDETKTVRHGLFASFGRAIQKSWEITDITYRALWRMITGKLSVKESVTGPLGIFYMTSRAANIGMVALLHLVAVLSVSLAIFNLLPLPVLDGGHIVLLFIERLRGKTLSPKSEHLISRIGFSLIITLAVFATYNDIARLFGDKIAKWFIK